MAEHGRCEVVLVSEDFARRVTVEFGLKHAISKMADYIGRTCKWVLGTALPRRPGSITSIPQVTPRL